MKDTRFLAVVGMITGFTITFVSVLMVMFDIPGLDEEKTTSGIVAGVGMVMVCLVVYAYSSKRRGGKVIIPGMVHFSHHPGDAEAGESLASPIYSCGPNPCYRKP